ncbi:MAG: Gfo/Idh/MocA family oxidoreductase [Melioribacteraceae bacterium]|jgi:predicted dehydrogenase|nr:Gfo/Idh/MocA family oxidoreductase [Melioribacteraceae bacterium]
MFKGAIIGFGKIARTSHFAAFQDIRLKDKVMITSAVEIDDNIRESSQKEFPNLKFYKTLDELFGNEKPDFVDIAVPPKFHKEIIEQALDKNLHIICEKPFTLSAKEAEELYRKINSSDILFVPCHQYKYSGVWGEFKNFINHLNDDDKVFIQFNIFRSGADPGLKPDGNPWRLNKEISGGGILSDTGFHYLYLSNWLLKNPLRITTINNNLAHPNNQIEDTSQVILEYEKGTVQINLTWVFHSRRNEAKLISKKGSLFYNGKNFLIKNIYDSEEQITVPDISDKSHYTGLYADLFSDFLNALESKNYFKDGVIEAYNAITLLTKCYQSAAELKSIDIKNEQKS